MLTAREARRLDLNSEALGVGVPKLMARAGAALAREVTKAARGKPVLFLCGKGHNGGDGLVAASLLQKAGDEAWVVLAEPPARLSPACRPLIADLDRYTVTAWRGRPERAWAALPVLVDCLLGTGAEGSPRGPYASLLRYLRRRAESGATVVACDVPSALGSTSAVVPASTVTFHVRKHGMTKANSGRIVVAPIGIPRAADTDVGPGDLWLGYPQPRPDSHKGDNGVVAVVAGGPYTGAPYYSGMAAVRTGADLVHAYIPADAAAVVATWGPEVLVRAAEPGAMLTPIGAELIRPQLRIATALVIGPGLGTSRTTREAARILLEEAATLRLPTVVDADGLDAVDADLLGRHGSRMVLTPHAAEFRDLAGTEANEANVHRYASRHGVTVIRKSNVCAISDGVRKRRCRRGHPTMTVGGTGDVLAGAIGEILAKGTAPFEATCAGAYLVGRAGELAAERLSYGATALDVLDCIPRVLLSIP